MAFDYNSLRLPATFELGIVATKLLTTIPVRKPKSGYEFFRTRPEPEWTFPTFIFDLKEGEEDKYLVIPELMSEVASSGKLKPVMIFALINFAGQVFFISDIPFQTQMERITSIIDPEGKLMRWQKISG